MVSIRLILAVFAFNSVCIAQNLRKEGLLLAQQPWPSTDTSVWQNSVLFTPNFSGIKYAAGATLADDRIWAADNDGVIWKLKWETTRWIADPAWGTAGRTMNQLYDSEGITVGNDGFGYFSTERIGSGSSDLAIYQFSLVDPVTAGATLTPNKKWSITALLPSAAGNAGLEALTFIPDANLVAMGFKASSGTVYNPASYPNKVAGGVFFAGLEANGNVYAVVLNSDLSVQLLATISSGETAVMDLEFDPANNYLWTSCDNNCAGRHHVFTTTNGVFTEKANIVTPVGPIAISAKNIEGFTIEPESRCGAVTPLRKYVYWADDDTGALFRSTIKCGSEGAFLNLGANPTVVPTVNPTSQPATPSISVAPTKVPTSLPSTSVNAASQKPSRAPSKVPTRKPTNPTIPTRKPTRKPTNPP